MSIEEYGGMIIRNMDKTAKELIFAVKPYGYYLYRLAKDEIIKLDQLASFTVFVLTASNEKSIVISETGITLGQGDMVQVENSIISLKGMSSVTELLVSGVSESCIKSELVNTIREKDIYKVIKPWGYELWINGEHPGYSLKKVSIKAGTRTSLQYHRYKHETNVIFYGNANIHYKRQLGKPNNEIELNDIGTVKISPITSVEVCPDTIHRVEALTDIVLYETSTPHLDDVFRIQDDTVRDNGRIMNEHRKKI